MRDDFCAFILTHGRPDRVYTYETIRKAGYDGKVYIVIDDEDKTADQYRAKYGDMVLQFSKAEIAKTFDEGDNFNDRRAIIYARNACWPLARQVGCRYFIQLDDDYMSFEHRANSVGDVDMIQVTRTLGRCFEALLDFYIESGVAAVAFSQGGDHIGGIAYPGGMRFLRRKAMNSFVCSTDREFKFFGRVNEDVNTYTTLGRRGSLFFTVMQVKLNQKQTQTNAGGMTDLYLESGTYVKSFYSVMYCPSSVKVGDMGDPPGSDSSRIHHAINWHKTAPMILRQEHRK
jgi:hypothetical protein